MKRLTYTIAAAFALVAAWAVAALPASATGRELEQAYYDGHVVHFQLPSSESANTNGALIGCYHAGPNLAGTSRPAPAKLYALFVPGVTQHSCRTGRRRTTTFSRRCRERRATPVRGR